MAYLYPKYLLEQDNLRQMHQIKDAPPNTRWLNSPLDDTSNTFHAIWFFPSSLHVLRAREFL